MLDISITKYITEILKNIFKSKDKAEIKRKSRSKIDRKEYTTSYIFLEKPSQVL